jgi:diaminohydroxyphosphoribosylaminopyrimidine deaminase / 5-amino-6-(5-phosphoribosylamino)uracil reductase
MAVDRGCSIGPGAEATDKMWALLALQASTNLRLTPPNPRVACGLVSADGRSLGVGATQRSGQAHAEVMALQAAGQQGHLVEGRLSPGSTAYVTLEPCCHHGRTGPCTEALIAAGVSRVVIAALDPNPKVSGGGVAALRAAGVEVEVLPPDSEPARACRELNIGFFSRFERLRPWVRLKVAVSLDGRTALPNGVSQWITGEAARADGHGWRARADAVLTGFGTVRDDDPALTVRAVDTPRQPHRVVLDSRLQTPPSARVLHADTNAPGTPGQVWVYGADTNETESSTRAHALRARGADVRFLPTDASGKVNLEALLKDLAQREVNELHIEAGAALNASWLASGWIDELLVYTAPVLLGDGLPLASLGAREALPGLDSLERWRFEEIKQLGDDVLMRLRRRP